MILQGCLVQLRPLLADDAEVTLHWRLSERARFLNKGAQTVDEQRLWIVAHKGADEFNFIIKYKNMPVGMIAIYGINHQHKSALIGRFILGEKAIVDNAPVAFEAELLVCDYIFMELGLHKIYGDIVEDNIGVVRFRSYLGYHQDGFLRDHFWNGEAYQNMIAVSLLETEYWEKCRPRLISLIELFTKYSYQPSNNSELPMED